MQSLLTSLKNPVWVNAEHTMIDCVITTSQFNNEELPFTASPTDIEPHGRTLFDRIVAGEFGSIGEYVAPPPEPTYTPSSGEIPVTEV